MWKTIVNFPRYEVSSHGRIRNKNTNRILRSGNAKGYRFVVLTKDNVEHAIYIHKLVADEFIGPCPDGKEIDHKDDDKTNNRRRNLQYLTHIENVRKSKHTKLTMEDAEVVREVYESGWYTLTLLGYIFDVNICTIHDIIHKRTWV